jgi:tape measure domain-containing protein
MTDKTQTLTIKILGDFNSAVGGLKVVTTAVNDVNKALDKTKTSLEISNELAVKHAIQQVQAERIAQNVLIEKQRAYEKLQNVVKIANNAIKLGSMQEAEGIRVVTAALAIQERQVGSLLRETEKLRIANGQLGYSFAGSKPSTVTKPVPLDPDKIVNYGTGQITSIKAIEAERLASIAREKVAVDNFVNRSELLRLASESKVAAFKERMSATSNSVIRANELQRIAIVEARERQAAINAQSFSQRMGSQPRISSQGSQIDITGVMSRGLREQTREVNANTEAHGRNGLALDQVIATHRSLSSHIINIMGLYKLYNAIYNTVINSIQSIPRIGIELETTKSALIASTGTVAGMTTVFTSLNKEAQRTGISITTLRETFRNFHASTSIAGEELETTWKMFTNINTVITALHLPADKASGVFLALAQIFNKTKVQSEELVKQLGNLLPGAFAAFAKANNLSTLELVKNMKAGTILAHDTILNFTEFYSKRFQAAFAVASEGLNSSIGRMNTAFTLLGESIYKSTSGPLIATIKGLTSLADWFRRDSEGINLFGKALAVLGTTLNLVLGTALLQKARNFFFLETAIRTATGSIVASTAASRLLATSMAFLSSPGAIVAGIVIIGHELYKLIHTNDEVRASIDKVLEAYSKPIPANASVEEKIKITAENDPFIKDTKELYAKQSAIVIEEKKRIANILRQSPWQANIPFSPLRLLISQLEIDSNVLKKLGITIDQALGGITDSIEQAEKANEKPPVDFTEARLNLQEARYDKEGRAIEAAISRYTRANAAVKKEADSIVDQFRIPLLTPPKFNQEQYEQAVGYLKDYKQGLKDATESARLQASGSNSLDNVFEITSKNIAKQAEQAKADTEILISKLELARDKYITETKVSSLQGRVIPEQEQLVRLAEFDKKILNEKKRLSQEIISLNSNAAKQQELSSEKQINNFEKAYSVIQKIESSGNKRAVSKTGALGLMQVQPSTLASPGFGMEGVSVDRNILALEHKARVMHEKLTSVEKEAMADYAEANSEVFAEFGRRYYKAQVDYFKGDLVKGAAAYNAGAGAVEKGKLPQETKDYIDKFKLLYDGKGAQNQLNLVTNIKTEQATLNSLQIEGDKLHNEGLRKTAELLKAQQDQYQLLKIEVLDATGNTKEADINRLKLEYAARKLDLEGKGNKVSTALLDTVYKEKLVKLEIGKLQENYNLALTKDQALETLIANQREAGFLTQQQASIKILESKQELAKAENILINSLKEQIKLGSQNKQLIIDLTNLEIERENRVAAAKAFSKSASQDFGISMTTGTIVGDFSQLEKEKEANMAKAGEIKDSSLSGLQTPESGNLRAIEEYQKQKADIEKKYGEQSALANMQYFKGVATVGANTFEELTSAAIKMYGAQSKQAKIAFMAYKAFKVAEIGIATAQAVMQALATSGNIYVGIALAAVAAGMGAIQIAKVIATPMPAAHGGLTEVPEEQTYLLNKGERVLSPNQNRDLVKFMNQRVQSGSQPTQQVKQAPAASPNIRIINAIDPSVFNEHLGSEEGEKAVMNIVRKNRG